MLLARGLKLKSIYTGHIFMKKELAGRTNRQKCLRGPQKDKKSSLIPHKTVVSTKIKGKEF